MPSVLKSVTDLVITYASKLKFSLNVNNINKKHTEAPIDFS